MIDTLIQNSMTALKEQMILTIENSEQKTAIDGMVQIIPEEAVEQYLNFLPAYDPDKIYPAGTRLLYGGLPWQNPEECKGQEPELSTAWHRIYFASDFPEWTTSSVIDAGKGCHFNGKNWISNVNGNTSVPGSDTSWSLAS